MKQLLYHRVFISVLGGLLLVFLSWPAALSLSDSLQRMQWFHLTDDEAQHTELIERLSQTGQYGEWSGPPFAPRLTTGPSVVVPGAILQRLLGISSAHAGRSVVWVYHFLTLVALVLLSLQVFTPRPYTRAGLVIMAAATAGFFHLGFRGLSETGYYSYGVLGEGAGGFFILATVLAYTRGLLLPAGIFAGLTVLSKPTFAIFLICTLLITFFHSVRYRNPRIFTTVFSGILIPIGLWIGWMVYTLGVEETLTWWKAYPTLMRNVNGGGLPSGEWNLVSWMTQLPATFLAHVQGLPTIASNRTILISLAGYAFLIYGTFKIYRRSTLFEFLFLFSTLHLGWWFLMSPGTQARYLFPAAVTCWTGFVFFCFYFANFFLDSWQAGFEKEQHNRGIQAAILPKPSRIAIVAALGLVIFHFGTKTVNSWNQNAGNWESCGLCRQLLIQDYWKKLEDRPMIWTSSSKADKELLLTAPYKYTRFEPDQLSDVPKGAWVSYGDFAKKGSARFLKKRRCRTLFTVPNRWEGFWVCP